MTPIDREITQYEGETFSSHDDSIKWLKESYQRVIDDTKEKCIEALPKKIPDSKICPTFISTGFNLAIQQAKQNIGRMR